MGSIQIVSSEPLAKQGKRSRNITISHHTLPRMPSMPRALAHVQDIPLRA